MIKSAPKTDFDNEELGGFSSERKNYQICLLVFDAETRLCQLYETQIEGIWEYDDTDMLPGSYPPQKIYDCMVWNII